jgi:hypothetical protein
MPASALSNITAFGQSTRNHTGYPLLLKKILMEDAIMKIYQFTKAQL